MGWAQTALSVGTGWVVAGGDSVEGVQKGWKRAAQLVAMGWVVAEGAAAAMVTVAVAVGAETAARAARAASC